MGAPQPSIDTSGEPKSLRAMLEFLDTVGVHLVVRGTYLPDTVRCTTGNPVRIGTHVPELKEMYDAAVGDGDGVINCYIDIRVGAYLLGSGPGRLTVLGSFQGYTQNTFGATPEANAAGVKAAKERMEAAVQSAVGREEIIFLGPALFVSTEVWQFWGAWRLERQDEQVMAIHPHREYWKQNNPAGYELYKASLTLTLPELKAALSTAHQSRIDDYDGRIGADEELPMLVTDANNLRDYYEAVGAYDDGHVPAQPPPVPQR